MTATDKLRALVDAYADAFDAHEQSVYDYAQAEISAHRAALAHASARYRETSQALLAARGAILAALESAQ